MIKNDRKKLDMDSADPQNRSEWRGRLRGRLVKKPNLGRGKRALKRIYDDDDDSGRLVQEQRDSVTEPQLLPWT